MRERFAKAARHLFGYIDWLVTLAIATTVTVLALTGKATSTTVQAATLGVLSLMALNAIRDRIKWRLAEDKLDYVKANVLNVKEGNELLLDRERTGIERILGGVVDQDWLREIRTAREVTIIKIKANFTNSPEYFAALEGVLDRGGSVTIVLSDPRAPAVVLRYFDEPTALRTARSVVTSHRNQWVNGLEEIAADIRRLTIWLEGLVTDGRNISRLHLKVSTHYPTHAFLKFDQRLYVYHYPFMGRGFHSPCLLFTGYHTPTYRYLAECMEAVAGEALPLDGCAEDIWARCKLGEFSDRSLEKLDFGLRRLRGAAG